MVGLSKGNLGQANTLVCLLSALQQPLGPESRLSRHNFVENHQIPEKMFCGNANFGMVGSDRRRSTSQIPHQCSYNGDGTPQTTFKITCHLVYLSLLSELDRYGFDMDGRIFNQSSQRAPVAWRREGGRVLQG